MALQLEKRTNQRIPDELFRWLKKERISAKDILFIADRMSPIQIRNYLQKQKPYFDGSCRQALTTWQDYLGNLAIVCAQRPDVLMQIYGGTVSIHVGEGPERATLSTAWEDDDTIQDMIRELNFGRYAAHPRKKEEGAA